MTDAAALEATPSAAPDESLPYPEPDFPPARGSTLVVLAFALAMTVVFLFAIATLASPPGGGCGGG